MRPQEFQQVPQQVSSEASAEPEAPSLKALAPRATTSFRASGPCHLPMQPVSALQPAYEEVKCLPSDEQAQGGEVTLPAKATG